MLPTTNSLPHAVEEPPYLPTANENNSNVITVKDSKASILDHTFT